MTIKPCPFCKLEMGYIAHTSRVKTINGSLFAERCVECCRCWARGPVAYTDRTAINRWNKAHTPCLKEKE